MFYLRAVELGLSITDLELLDIGLVIDMFTEKMNDSDDEQAATQENFDNF